MSFGSKYGYLIAHTDKNPNELRKDLSVEKARIYTINAMRIALDILGRPIYNTVMLGALVKVIPITELSSLIKVIKKRFPGALGEKNEAVMKEAYENVKGVE